MQDRVTSYRSCNVTGASSGQASLAQPQSVMLTRVTDIARPAQRPGTRNVNDTTFKPLTGMSSPNTATVTSVRTRVLEYGHTVLRCSVFIWLNSLFKFHRPAQILSSPSASSGTGGGCGGTRGVASAGLAAISTGLH